MGVTGEETMPIGVLSERTGVSVRALRHYEQARLLHPDRTSAGHRRFRAADVESVRRIRLLLRAGLPLTVIAQILPCFIHEGSHLDACVANYLQNHLATVSARIKALDDQQNATSVLLEQLIAQ